MEKDVPSSLPSRLGNSLFRYRSYTPVPLAIILVWQAEVNFPIALVGLVLMLGGELIRLAAVRSFGRGVRTRQVGASQLVTGGLYAHTRNPLYLGNLILWMGAVFFAGGPFMPWLLGAALMFFLIQYTLIISVEEATLLELFGESYVAYCQSVPRIFPRFRTSQKTAKSDVNPIRSWRYAFQHERSTLTAIVTVLLLTLLSTVLKA